MSLGQFDAALYGKIRSVRSDFDSHESAVMGIHGATSDATASRLIIRDGNGRAKVVNPPAASDDTTVVTTEWARDTFTTSSGVTRITEGTGMDFSVSPISTTGTIGLTDTAVTPDSYSAANITVDQQGRITAISHGEYPVISGLSAGTYNSANVTVNNTGFVTDISSNAPVNLLPSDESDSDRTWSNVSSFTFDILDTYLDYDYLTIGIRTSISSTSGYEVSSVIFSSSELDGSLDTHVIHISFAATLVEVATTTSSTPGRASMRIRTFDPIGPLDPHYTNDESSGSALNTYGSVYALWGGSY